MPSQPTLTQTRLNNIITCFTGAVNTVGLLAETFKMPFLDAISKTSQSLLTAVEDIKQNKGDCAELMEQTYHLLHAVVSLHTKSATGLELPPSTLNHIGKFMETLHKIHTYVEAQQVKSQIRQFFWKEALEVFEVQKTDLLTAIAEIKTYEEERHQEVLQMIENLFDDSSSTSISMLPSEPKIFYGREAELAHILNLFEEKAPSIAILGPGGMGKTSLTKAVLHHPQIIKKFEEHRFFVACDSASTKVDLVFLIGAHLGLKPGKDLSRLIIQFLSQYPCLLILDNLETVWDPIESQRDVEEFLSVLTDVEHMALLITMWGAEKPHKVHWTHPLIPQLKPLTQDAARQIFIAIADDGHDPKQIEQASRN
ncbi:P-loop containing nucleoside triphosphate hydrolase protein [Mycena crocata]|nr:P-loop containing nucleoside triphosphate hydrolase protein [Mycena crocata]